MERGKKMESGLLTVPSSEQVEIFRDILEQAGRWDQAEDIGQLVNCLRSIRTNLEDAMDEVNYLLEQIQPVEEPVMKARLGGMQEEIRKSIHQAGKQVRAAEAEVIGGIQNTLQALREKGLQVLDDIFNTAHVSQGLGRAETLLMQAVSGLEKKMQAVDCIAEELHAIKGHAKNMGRAAVGKSAEEIAARDKTIGAMAKIRAGMEYCRKVLAGLGQKVLTARAHVEHLHQTIELRPEKVSSVQEITRELRDARACDFGRQPEPAQTR